MAEILNDVLGLTTDDLPSAEQVQRAKDTQKRWGENRERAERGEPVRLTTEEAVAICGDHDGVKYLYYRGINGMVLSHLRPDGYSVETPCGDLRMEIYQRIGQAVEIV